MIIGADEMGYSGITIGGGLDSHTTTKLTDIFFYNAIIVTIDCGALSSNAQVTLDSCNLQGSVTAKNVFANGSYFNVAAITIAPGLGASIMNCQFQQGSSPFLTGNGGFLFDGPSWQSFLTAGGNRNAATPVLVQGGYNGAEVIGATIASGSVNVSLNGTGASVGFTGSSSGNHYFAVLSANTSVFIKYSGGEKPGDTMIITKSTANYDLTIFDGSSNLLGIIGDGSTGFLLAIYTGTAWVFSSGSGLFVTGLYRQKYIDGDSLRGLASGSILQPYKTIQSFMVSRTNTSINDATANYVGIVAPATLGYTENITFPAYASTEIRAQSYSLGTGTAGAVINGNATWTNASGAHIATNAVVTIHNISISGTITVTDDATAPPATLLFGGDEGAGSGPVLGNIDSHTATHLQSVCFKNATVSNINCGTSSNSASVTADTSIIFGSILANSINALNCTISVATITVNSSGSAIFFNIFFYPASAPVLTCAVGALFDGKSWKSFVEAGGTRGTNTPILVLGGYNVAAVEGFPLPTSGTTSVSIDGTGGVSPGYSGSNSGNHYSADNLTANSIVNVIGAAFDGDTMLITKISPIGFSLTVQGHGNTRGVIPSGFRGYVMLQYSAAAGSWLFAHGGQLT
ncbi:MAG TPA: hypothetical protein VIE65_16970 [Methylobacter sp.]|jgi:hypothetical protein